MRTYEQTRKDSRFVRTMLVVRVFRYNIWLDLFLPPIAATCR